MNWSKAKTILIIIFLIADIFLFYELYIGTMGNRMTMDTERTKEAINYLYKQGISLENAIPESVSPKTTLTVRYKHLDKKYALDNFFHDAKDVKVSNYDDRVVMENHDVYLEVNNSGEIIYVNKTLSVNQKNPIDEKQALNNINAFLRNIGIEESSRYDEVKTIEEGYLQISCIQGYKNTFLDKSYLKIRSTNEGVFYMKILWFETVNNGKTKKEIIPPIKALIKLSVSEMYKDTEQSVIVSDISLGYYFNTDIEQVKDFDVAYAKEGTAIPVWRIKTNLGDIYINAYNGTVEKN